MAVLESGLEVPGSNASSDDTRRRCRLFSKVLQRKNREYPYLMQPNGSFAPDARPYGGKTLIIYLMVIMCLAAAFILFIIIALGPPSIPNMYLLQLCGREGCQTRFISIGVFQLVFYAASDDDSERTISVFSSWSGVYQRLEPAVLQDIVPEPPRTVAGLIICSIFLLLLDGACFAWAVGLVVSFNSHLSHGAGLPELILKREKALKLLIMSIIFSFAPFATLLAVIILVKSSNNASLGAFDVFTAYVSPWRYDSMHEGDAVVLLEAACGVLGTALVLAMLLVKRTAEPIAGRSEPPQVPGQRKSAYLRGHDPERAQFTAASAKVQGPDKHLAQGHHFFPRDGKTRGPHIFPHSSSSESSSLTDGTSYQSEVRMHAGERVPPQPDNVRHQEHRLQQSRSLADKKSRDQPSGSKAAGQETKSFSAGAPDDFSLNMRQHNVGQTSGGLRHTGPQQQSAAREGLGRRPRQQDPIQSRHKRKPAPQILCGSSFEALKSPIEPPGRTTLNSDFTPAALPTFGPDAFQYRRRERDRELHTDARRNHRQAHHWGQTPTPASGYAADAEAVAAGLQQSRRPGIVV